MQRREFLSATSGGFAIPLVKGLRDPLPKQIDVTLHESNAVYDDSWRDDKFHGLRVVAEYLELSYATYFDDYEMNITISEEPVDMTGHTGDEIFNEWNYRVGDSQQDCELLVHDWIPEYSGRGECSSCTNASRRFDAGREYSNAAVSTYGHHLDMADKTVRLWGSAWNWPTDAISIAIHEVGHSLGLTHELGYAYDVDGFNFSDEEAMVTPMLGGYSHLDPSEQADSFYGRDRFQVDRDNAYYQLKLGQDAMDYIRTYGYNFEW